MDRTANWCLTRDPELFKTSISGPDESGPRHCRARECSDEGFRTALRSSSLLSLVAASELWRPPLHLLLLLFLVSIRVNSFPSLPQSYTQQVCAPFFLPSKPLVFSGASTAQFRVGFFVAPVFMLSGICTVAFSSPLF
jgi:hypothetical protein